MPRNETFDSSLGDPRGVPSAGGYSPEVYDLLLDAGGRLAAFYAARAARARSDLESRRWLGKLAELREEVAGVDAQSNVNVVRKRNELLERHRAEASIVASGRSSGRAVRGTG